MQRLWLLGSPAGTWGDRGSHPKRPHPQDSVPPCRPVPRSYIVKQLSRSERQSFLVRRAAVYARRSALCCAGAASAFPPANRSFAHFFPSYFSHVFPFPAPQEFGPDYFRYVATMLHRGQDTCLAKVLGVYQVGGAQGLYFACCFVAVDGGDVGAPMGSARLRAPRPRVLADLRGCTVGQSRPHPTP